MMLVRCKVEAVKLENLKLIFVAQAPPPVSAWRPD